MSTVMADGAIEVPLIDDPATFAVHPFAAAFPMLSDEELDALAEDIKTNGQRHPILVQNSILIDGRNRLAACELADVEPWIEQLGPDADPVSLIRSENVRRRHMTNAQLATAEAIALAAEGKRQDGRWVRNALSGLSPVIAKSQWTDLMADAGWLIDSAEQEPDRAGDLPQQVLKGRPFDDAVAYAKQLITDKRVVEATEQQPAAQWLHTIQILIDQLGEAAEEPPQLLAPLSTQLRRQHDIDAKRCRSILRQIAAFIERSQA